jgi:hypothetical protein
MFGCEEAIGKDLTDALNRALVHLTNGFDSSEAGKAQSSWNNYLGNACSLVFDVYCPGAAARFGHGALGSRT